MPLNQGNYINVSSFLRSSVLAFFMHCNLLFSRVRLKPVIKLSIFALLVLSITYIATARQAFAAENGEILDPVVSQKEKEARAKRARAIKREELKKSADAIKASRFSDEYLKLSQQKENKKDQAEYKSNKAYMSYWQRAAASWRELDNLQDILDLALPTAYSPAKVSASYVEIKSGPGKGYPIIYIAEKDELVDFTAVRTDWYQVRTEDGHFGWINKSDMPNQLEILDDSFEFTDEAKKVAARSKPIDIGFSSGIMNDEPTVNLFIKRHQSYFMSLEAELGFTRGLNDRQDYLAFSVLAHPFIEFTYQPHIIVGLGRMRVESLDSTTNTRYVDQGFMGKAGVGFTRNLSKRLNIRGDITQYSVDVPQGSLNHYSALTLGASYELGTSSDSVFNRSIAKKVKVTDHELTLFTGRVNLSLADGVNVKGARLSYHVSENNFFELSYAQGNNEYRHTGVAVAQNLLPTEYSFKWRNTGHFWPTQIYVLAGGGMQFIQGDEQVSVTVGTGLRINPFRRFAVRLEARSHTVKRQSFNNQTFDTLLQNPELSFGLSTYF